MRSRLSVSHFKIGPKDVYENTMGMIVGDLNDDGFPDAYIGTGTPAWSEHDLLWLNMADASGGGWRGFARHVLAGGGGGRRTAMVRHLRIWIATFTRTC